jgi:hypothetical protein
MGKEGGGNILDRIEASTLPRDFFVDDLGMSREVSALRMLAMEHEDYPRSTLEVDDAIREHSNTCHDSIASSGDEFSGLIGRMNELTLIQSVKFTNWLRSRHGRDLNSAQLKALSLRFDDDRNGNYEIEGILPGEVVSIPKYEFDGVSSNMNGSSVDSFLELDIDEIDSAEELVRIYYMLTHNMLPYLRGVAGKDRENTDDTLRAVFRTTREKIALNDSLSGLCSILCEATKSAAVNATSPEMWDCRRLGKIEKQIERKLFFYMADLLKGLLGAEKDLDLSAYKLDVSAIGLVESGHDCYGLSLFLRKYFSSMSDEEILALPKVGIDLHSLFDKAVAKMHDSGDLEIGGLNMANDSVPERRLTRFWVRANSTTFAEQEKKAGLL